MAFVSESEATRLPRRSSCTRKKGAFRKTSNALRLIKILLHRLLDYRSCETDRCICIGCIGLDPPLIKSLTSLRYLLRRKLLGLPSSPAECHYSVSNWLLCCSKVAQPFTNNITLISTILRRTVAINFGKTK